MDPFFLTSDADLESMIKDLAEQIGRGAGQVQTDALGSVQYMSRADAMRVMKALQKSYFKRRGIAFVPDRIRYTQILPGVR